MEGSREVRMIHHQKKSDYTAVDWTRCDELLQLRWLQGIHDIHSAGV